MCLLRKWTWFPQDFHKRAESNLSLRRMHFSNIQFSSFYFIQPLTMHQCAMVFVSTAQYREAAENCWTDQKNYREAEILWIKSRINGSVLPYRLKSPTISLGDLVDLISVVQLGLLGTFHWLVIPRFLPRHGLTPLTTLPAFTFTAKKTTTNEVVRIHESI